MKYLATLFLAVLLSACSTTPTTPQQTIYQIEANYTAAAQIILAYKGLPPCPAATVLCSDPAVVAKLKDADNIAYASLKAAETVARSPGAGANAATAQLAAQQAIAALTAITATLATK